MKDPCIDDWVSTCGNGKYDEWENCDNCPWDLLWCIPDGITPYDSWWSIVNDNCNICPCEYADFSADLIKWDMIRAKLWDKSSFTFYRYSNIVALDNFPDIGL